MEFLTQLRRQFEYEFWADARVIQALTATPCPRGVELIAHIHICQGLWLNRLDGLDTSRMNVWPNFSLDQVRLLGEKMRRQVTARLEQMTPAGLDETLNYIDLSGTPRSFAIGAVFQQLLFHGAYHRGQIADEIRRAGGTPLRTDFIVWERER